MNKASWSQGAFEIRAKFTGGQGMHPTFWFLNGPDRGANTDTFSMVESDAGALGNSVYAHEDCRKSRGICQDIYTLPAGQTFAQGYHVFRMEWDATRQPATFRNYVDGSLYSAPNSRPRL